MQTRKKRKKLSHRLLHRHGAGGKKDCLAIVSGINSQTGAAIRPGWSGNHRQHRGEIFFLRTGEVLLRKTDQTDTELRLRGGNDVPASGTGSAAERNTAPDGIARAGQIADRIPTADGENRTGNEFLRL